jgi:hypothetical protein
MQHFGDFAHGRDKPLFAHAKADPAPALQAGFLGWQVSGQQATATVDVQQQLEGGL